MREWQHDADEVHARRWLTLVVLCLSLVVIIVDNSILNVALPTLARPEAQGGLGASDSDLQWIVDAYVLVFAGLLLTAGSLGDRFGRYRALAVGLAVFGIGSALAAFSDSSGALIAARAVMGVGGACIMPATLSIITNVFTDPRERGRAIGVWAGVSALGLAVGPLTGGLLLEHFWWGSVLLVNVPIVIVALAAGFVFVPDSRDPAAPRVDVLGALLSIAGLVAVVWALIEGPTAGWTSVSVLGAFAAGIVLLVLFVLWEAVTDQPMLDIDFFRNPRFSVASAAITLTFMSLMGMIFLLTQYLQSVLLYSPLKAGAILLPMSAVLLVLAPTSARIVERVGTKAVLGTGLLIVSAALALQTTLEVSTPTIQVIGLTMLLATGMANVMAPATESIMGSLPRAKAGVGSAVNDTTRQVGGAIGVALLGSLLSSVYRSDVREGLAGTPMPPELVDAASSTVQAAVRIGEPAGAAGDQIIATAYAAFLSGYHLAVLVAAGFTLAGAAAVFLWLPARGADAGAPGGLASAEPGSDGGGGADGAATACRLRAGTGVPDAGAGTGAETCPPQGTATGVETGSQQREPCRGTLRWTASPADRRRRDRGDGSRAVPGTLAAMGAPPDAVTLAHHDSDDYSWTMAHRRPHTGLAGIVHGNYCGYEEDASAPVSRREVATGRVTVILTFGDPLELVEMSSSSMSPGQRLTSFVAGLHNGYAVTTHDGDQAGIQVDLTPLGAARVLGGPHEVANECVPLDALLGRFAGELTERLAASPGWAERFSLLDDVLLHRASEAPEPHPAIAWAWHQLVRSHGQVSVGVLAEEIGWSRRHFATRFRDSVGLAPKPTARILRFRRAVDLLDAGPVRSIADLAAACGYADHSHLVREFRLLGGCTPSQYVQSILPDGGGVAG